MIQARASNDTALRNLNQPEGLSLGRGTVKLVINEQGLLRAIENRLLSEDGGCSTYKVRKRPLGAGLGSHSALHLRQQLFRLL